MAYAHTANNVGRRHDLVEHLRSVGKSCAVFASSFGAAEIARLIGLWHDIGKFDPAFQDYLLASERDPTRRRRGPDHKAAGAKCAVDHGFAPGALLIQGHHGGMRARSDLKFWIETNCRTPGVEAALEAASAALPEIVPQTSIALPDFVEKDPLAAELFLRLLFSCLVDADFLDTESHFSQKRADARSFDVSLSDLWERFQASQARFSNPQDAVSITRHQIYKDALRAANSSPGVFRLTAPTGAGKTRASMAFALRHALRNGQQRVIVAVPFISITEQTADVYRRIFELEPGSSVVLEHHSAATEDRDEAEDFDPSAQWSRLAAENWDAPVIVTTTVQLFESIFASSTSRCRKVHRIANSVLILDEAQALPEHLLKPILDVTTELAERHNTSVVFVTATQPAFESIPEFPTGSVREIVNFPERHFRALKRVGYEWALDPPLEWHVVANGLRVESQVLAVVNTKNDALSLLEELDDRDALHLSTLLCPAHRRRVIAEARRRLERGLGCRLVSTQVIEAGVDIDFPVVWRALGPLDGIIQSAGRCNREGHLPQGSVVVFRPASGSLPPGFYQAATDVTTALLCDGSVDPEAPDVVSEYFRRLYGTWMLDREGIQEARKRFDFPTVSRRFRMIDDQTQGVIVQFGTDEERTFVRDAIVSLRKREGRPRLLLRRLRPYMVMVRVFEFERLRRKGLATEVIPGLWEWHGEYHDVTGLRATGLKPDQLVV